MSVPITLSYHAGGTKVAELASWVGLGWSMQANGMITRVIQGVPDDDVTKIGYYQNGSLLNLNNPDQFIECGQGLRDAEPDIFSYSFGGYSGKFFFNKDKLPEFIERKDWLVTPIFESGGFTFDGFVLTVENGTRYHFGKVAGSTSAPMIERSAISSEQSYQTTSWYLVRIESHDLKDFINFNYTPECSQYKQAIFSKRIFSRAFFGTAQCNATDKLAPDVTASGYSTVLQNGQRLTSITNSSGTQTVNFDATTVREDIEPHSYCGSTSNRLDAIRLVSGTYTIKYNLGYDYIGNGTTAESKRLRLLNVKRQLNNADEQIYGLDYENTLGNATAYPSILSKQIDHWGYYNGQSGNDALFCLAPSTKVMDDDANTLTYGSANRESSETHLKHGILKRINYPTGGFSEFEFEANKHSAIENVVSENQVFYIVAGYEFFNAVCQSTLTTADKCFPLENIPLTNYKYRVGVYNTINGGSQTCSSTSNVKVQFFDAQTNIEVASINPSSSTTWLSLSDISGLLPNKTYKVKITGYDVTTCVFEVNKVSTNTQLVTRNIGGLRIKQITNYDGISTNNNVVKTYEYLKDNSTASSGYLFALPKYGHYITNGDLSVKAFIWQSGSITPMANFQGYTIGYQRVVEKTLGNVGKTVYEYKIETNMNYPGEAYGSSKDNFPVTPIPISLGSGQLDQSSQYDNVNNLIASTTNTGSTFLASTITTLYNKFYSTEELIPPSDPNNPSPQTCPYVPNNQSHSGLARTYKVSKYNIPTGTFRLLSKIDMLDGVNTSTTFKYAPVSSHQLPLGTITTNSDNKTTETFNKYVMDYTGGELATTTDVLITTDLVANLKSRNIISTPIETLTKVTSGTSTTTIDGRRTRYSFYDASGNPTATVGTNPIYVYKSYDYEAPHDYSAYSESRWQLKETLDTYDMTVGEPSKYTQAGWNVSETYTYGTNRLMTDRQFGTAPFLKVQYAFVPNTRLVDTYTDENGLLKRYTYDPLMRLLHTYSNLDANGANQRTTTTNSYNYYNTTSATPCNHIISNTTFVDGNAPIKTISFLDGLGRNYASTKWAYTGSPGGNGSQNSYIAFDNLGRQSKAYQPFETFGNTIGCPTEPTSSLKVETKYEASPLSRPIEQIMQDGKSVKTYYGTNTVADAVRMYINSVYSTDFAPNTLYKTTMEDENGKKTEVYKDKLGRIILTRKFLGTQKVDTYNLYDDFGKLVSVLPPDCLDKDSDLAFTYTYDNRNRPISKRVPGADRQDFYYDERDLLVLTQDGNMGNADVPYYMATKYDVLGRPVKTGFVYASVAGTTRSVVETFAKTDFALGELLTETVFETNKSRPLSTKAKVVNPQSGDAAWIETALTYKTNSNLLERTTSNNHVNRYSGTYTAYTDANEPYQQLKEMFGSDGQYFLDITYQGYDNGHRNNQTSKFYVFDLAWTTLTPELIMSKKTFDPLDRMSEKNIGGRNISGTIKYVQSIDYFYNTRIWLTGINSLNAFQNDKPLLNCNTESAFNNAYQGLGNVGGDPVAQGNDQNPDLFSQTLTYGNPITAMPGSAPPQYNGNISQTMWQVAGREAQGYAFQYDDLNRLTNATSSDFHSLEGQNGGLWQSSPYSADNKYKESVAYDVRGNITSLQRNGLLSEGLTVNGIFCGNFGEIDNLGYTYNSKNQIRSITDVTGSDKGFIKKSTSSDAYEYDSNGNLKKDLNKGITEITYNHLNLPLRITFNRTYPTAYDNGYIEFMYDAAGNKLRKSTYLTNGTLIDKRDYLSGWIEYNKLNQPELIHNEEGMMRKQANGTWLQEYFLKDHLGNTRVTFTDANSDGNVSAADIKQINHYYPFGLNMEGSWSGAAGANKYTYNGKEWNDDFGLGWNHHDWRFYDVAIGRFVTVDPEGESDGQISISPYHFSYDNPIRFSDPDGREGEECCGSLAQMTGGVVGFTDNLLGTNLRESVGNHLFGSESSMRTSFDNGVRQADQVSLVGGTGLVAGGGIAAAGGGTVSLTGVGATVGVPVAAVGGVAIVVGGALAINAAKNLQNSQVKAKENRRDGKEHTTGARQSTENKHQEGASRKAKEQQAADAKYAKTKSTKEAKSNNQKKKENPDYKKPGPKLKA